MIVVLQQLAIAVLSMVIGTFICLKIAKNTIKNMVFDVVYDVKDDLKADLEQWINGETGQKAIYQIGGLIGSGARQGIGIQKSGGKKGMEGIIIELLGGFLQKKIGVNPMQQTQNNDRSQTPQGLNRA